MFADNPKILKLLVIGIFAVVVPLSIIGINMFEKNVSNPRIWENWTCDEMEKFALEDRDDNQDIWDMLLQVSLYSATSNYSDGIGFRF